MLSPSSVPLTRYCYWTAPLVIGRRHSVVVITGDFESLDAGSNPAGELIISPVIVIGHYHQCDRQIERGVKVSHSTGSVRGIE